MKIFIYFSLLLYVFYILITVMEIKSIDDSVQLNLKRMNCYKQCEGDNGVLCARFCKPVKE